MPLRGLKSRSKCCKNVRRPAGVVDQNRVLHLAAAAIRTVASLRSSRLAVGTPPQAPAWRHVRSSDRSSLQASRILKSPAAESCCVDRAVFAKNSRGLVLGARVHCSRASSVTTCWRLAPAPPPSAPPPPSERRRPTPAGETRPPPQPPHRRRSTPVPTLDGGSHRRRGGTRCRSEWTRAMIHASPDFRRLRV